jgi:hypothetical protein
MNNDIEVDNDIDDNNIDVGHDHIHDDNLDVDYDNDALLRFRSINDILRTTGFAPCALVAEELHAVSSDEESVGRRDFLKFLELFFNRER